MQQGDSAGGPEVRTPVLSAREAWVPSLVREVRLHMPRDVAERSKQTNKQMEQEETVRNLE